MADGLEPGERVEVYEQIMDALRAHTVVEFGGIEANPRYETLMGGVELALCA